MERDANQLCEGAETAANTKITVLEGTVGGECRDGTFGGRAKNKHRPVSTDTVLGLQTGTGRYRTPGNYASYGTWRAVVLRRGHEEWTLFREY